MILTKLSNIIINIIKLLGLTENRIKLSAGCPADNES